MKNLKDLKEDILNNKIEKFYVFYGEDYGLRHHYIQEIGKHFDKIDPVYDMENFVKQQTGGGLFKKKRLLVAHGEVDFAKQKPFQIQSFISKLVDDTFILCFEQELPSTTLWKDFNDYITYFPIVDDKISLQFVDSELSLNQKSKEELAGNCLKNYNNILLEADKIRNYAQAKGISEQAAYDILDDKQQLLYEYEEFHSYNLMNDLLKGNINSLSYWHNVVKANFQEEFWIAMESIMNDYIIAYLIVQNGRFNGGNKAYDLGLPWFRIKMIRDFAIPYSAQYLLETAFKISKLDNDIKTGKIEKEKLFDYFMCCII